MRRDNFFTGTRVNHGICTRSFCCRAGFWYLLSASILRISFSLHVLVAYQGNMINPSKLYRLGLVKLRARLKFDDVIAKCL